MKTFYIEAAGSDLRISLRDRTHFLSTKLTILNTVLGRLEKSSYIVESIRITISKDHNN